MLLIGVSAYYECVVTFSIGDNTYERKIIWNTKLFSIYKWDRRLNISQAVEFVFLKSVEKSYQYSLKTL